MSLTRHYLIAALPYLAVLIGLYVFSSAWTAVLLYQAGIVIVIARLDSPWRQRLQGWRWSWAAAHGALGLVGGLLMYFLWPWLGLEQSLAARLPGIGLSGLSWPLFLLYFSLVNPWFEEVLWRGYLAGESRTLESGDILFAGYHVLVLRLFLDWPWVLVATLILVAAAWVWRQLATRLGGLLVPATSHMVGALSISAVLFFRV